MSSREGLAWPSPHHLVNLWRSLPDLTCQARYSGHGQYGAAADYAAGEDYFDD